MLINTLEISKALFKIDNTTWNLGMEEYILKNIDQLSPSQLKSLRKVVDDTFLPVKYNLDAEGNELPNIILENGEEVEQAGWFTIRYPTWASKQEINLAYDILGEIEDRLKGFN